MAKRRAVCSQPSLCSPAAPAPGHLQCPVCLALGSCSQSSNVMCPEGTSHCYTDHGWNSYTLQWKLGILTLDHEGVTSKKILISNIVLFWPQEPSR